MAATLIMEPLVTMLGIYGAGVHIRKQAVM